MDGWMEDEWTDEWAKQPPSDNVALIIIMKLISLWSKAKNMQQELARPGL